MKRKVYAVFLFLIIVLNLRMVLVSAVSGDWGFALLHIVLASSLVFLLLLDFCWTEWLIKPRRRPTQQTIFITTGGCEVIGEKATRRFDEFPEGHFICYDARSLEDPSELVGDLFGTDPQVWAALCELNPGLEEDLHQRAELWLENPRFFRNECVEVFVFCEAGWHRSVAVGEKLAEIFKEKGHDVDIRHLGARNG